MISYFTHLWLCTILIPEAQLFISPWETSLKLLGQIIHSRGDKVWLQHSFQGNQIFGCGESGGNTVQIGTIHIVTDPPYLKDDFHLIAVPLALLEASESASTVEGGWGVSWLRPCSLPWLATRSLEQAGHHIWKARVNSCELWYVCTGMVWWGPSKIRSFIHKMKTTPASPLIYLCTQWPKASRMYKGLPNYVSLLTQNMSWSQDHSSVP